MRPTLNETKISTAVEMSRVYYESYGAGGSLHIALDDGNMEDSHIAFCLKYALEHDDPEGMKLAEFLLTMTLDERDELYERYEEYRA